MVTLEISCGKTKRSNEASSITAHAAVARRDPSWEVSPRARDRLQTAEAGLGLLFGALHCLCPNYLTVSLKYPVEKRPFPHHIITRILFDEY